MKVHPGALVLSVLALACGGIGLATDAKWALIGFFLFGGLAAVIWPRQMAGDPKHDVGSGGWFMPDSQPARTIVMFAVGLFCLAAALVYALR